MPPIKSWILDFMLAHIRRHFVEDFPMLGSDESKQFVRMWHYQFTEHQVTEREADAASNALGGNPPRFRPDHLPALMAMIHELRAKAAFKAGTATIEQANAAAVGCKYCSEVGSKSPDPLPTGRVTIYHPRYNNSRVLGPHDHPSITRPTAAITTVYCVCALGQMLANKAGPPPDKRQVPTLQDVLDGRLNWLLEDPTLATVAVPAPNKKPTTVPAKAPQPENVQAPKPQTSKKDTTKPSPRPAA